MPQDIEDAFEETKVPLFPESDYLRFQQPEWEEKNDSKRGSKEVIS